MAHSCPDSRAATSAPFSPRGEMTKCLHGRQKTRPKDFRRSPPCARHDPARKQTAGTGDHPLRPANTGKHPGQVPRTPKTSRNPPGKTLSSCLPASPHRPLVKKIFPSNEKQFFLKREKNLSMHTKNRDGARKSEYSFTKYSSISRKRKYAAMPRKPHGLTQCAPSPTIPLLFVPAAYAFRIVQPSLCRKSGNGQDHPWNVTTDVPQRPENPDT